MEWSGNGNLMKLNRNGMELEYTVDTIDTIDVVIFHE